MAKGLIGRHLNDYSPVFNMEGVWQRPQRETLWLLLLTGGWQVSLSLPTLPVNLCIQCQQMYVYECSCSPRTGLCAWVAYCVNVWMFECVFACVRSPGMCAIWLAGMHTSPAEILTQSHHKAEKVYIRQITASNGRNKTPFNEHANLRNITLCSEI